MHACILSLCAVCWGLIHFFVYNSISVVSLCFAECVMRVLLSEASAYEYYAMRYQVSSLLETSISWAFGPHVMTS